MIDEADRDGDGEDVSLCWELLRIMKKTRDREFEEEKCGRQRCFLFEWLH